MPPLPSQSLPALRSIEARALARPREDVVRCVERAEALAGEIVPDLEYPEEWLADRLGVPSDTGARAAVAGRTVLAGLPVLVERLCAAISLGEDEVRGESAASLQQRWGISRATLVRLRKRGLVARRVHDRRRRARLVFTPGVVAAFAAAHADELAHAAGFSRMTARDRARLLRRAARYRRCLGWSLHKAASRLAARQGRSVEAVRQVLRGHDARAGAGAIFGSSPPLDARRGEVMRRAWRLGVDLGLMSRRTRRSRASLRRAINLARAARLRSLVQSGVLQAGGERSRASPESLLTPAPVREGLGGGAPATLAALLAAARRRTPPVAVEERTRLLAYHALRRLAARDVARIHPLQPQAGLIDLIETRLRWASRLKAELVRAELRVIVGTLETRLGQPLDQTPTEVARPAVLDAIHAASDAIDAMDPSRGGRVAAAVALAVDRVAVRWSRDERLASRAKRASTLLPAGVALEDWTRRMNPWQAWLEPPPRVRAAPATLDADAREFLAARYGWDGGPPRTLRELTREFRVSPPRAPIVEQRAVRACLVSPTT